MDAITRNNNSVYALSMFRQQVYRFAPGDRAVITRCDNLAHIGRIVRIIRLHKTPQSDWIVELLGTPVRGRSIYDGRVGDFVRVTVFEWNLTPLAEGVHSGQQDHHPVDATDPQTF